MKIFIKILLFLFCIGCSNPSTEKTEYETNLSEANVSRITERLEIVITSVETDYPEDTKLITDNVIGFISNKTVYGENGKAILHYTYGTEGLILYSRHPYKRYPPSFTETHYRYECQIYKDGNYIIDIMKPMAGRFVVSTGIFLIGDTIRDFVIIPKDKIILSKDDYKLLQKAKNGKEWGERYILYRYE